VIARWNGIHRAIARSGDRAMERHASRDETSHRSIARWRVTSLDRAMARHIARSRDGASHRSIARSLDRAIYFCLSL
jgi:hypothetical protein